MLVQSFVDLLHFGCYAIVCVNNHCSQEGFEGSVHAFKSIKPSLHDQVSFVSSGAYFIMQSVFGKL